MANETIDKVQKAKPSVAEQEALAGKMGIEAAQAAADAARQAVDDARKVVEAAQEKASVAAAVADTLGVAPINSRRTLSAVHGLLIHPFKQTRFEQGEPVEDFLVDSWVQVQLAGGKLVASV